MFSKSLIIILSVCTLALANPILGNGNLIPQLATPVNIGSWLNDAHYGIRKSFKQTVQPFITTYDALVEASKNVQNYNKDQIEHLRILFHEITDKSRENLNDIENAVLTNTVVSLQTAVELLNRKGLEQLLNQNIQTGQNIVDKTNQNVQQIIGSQINNAKDNVGQLQDSLWSGINGIGQSAPNIAQKVQGTLNNQIGNVKDNIDNALQFLPGKISISDKLGGGVHGVLNGVNDNTNKAVDSIKQGTGFFSNLGNTVQGVVDGGVENVKDNLNQWGNNWAAGLKVGEDIFSNFGDKAHGALNNGINTIGNGIENVKGNLNNLGNGVFGLADNFNKFGNQAQNILGNGINGVQNQVNKFVPSNNNYGIFDSRQALDIVAKQLAGTVAVLIRELEQNLYQWKNIANNFLANIENNVQQQTQHANQGLHNILGSVGYMPNIDAEQLVSNIPTLNDGIFSKIGQKVGGNIGEGVDKFTGAVGGFFNNAGKLFG